MLWAKGVPSGAAGAPFAPPASAAFPTGGLTAVVGGSVQGKTAYVCRAYHREDHSGPHSGYSTGRPLLDGGPAGAPPVCIFSYGSVAETAYEFDVLFLAPPSFSPDDVAALAANTTVIPWPSRSASPSPSLSSTPSAPPSATPSPLPPGTLAWRAVAWGAVSRAPSTYVTTGVDVDQRSPLFVCRVRPGGSNVSTGGAYNAPYSRCAAPVVGEGGWPRVHEVLAATPWLQWAAPGALSEVGATGVSAGPTAAGGAPMLCRAYHPTTRAGPLGGVFDDSVLYETGAPLGAAIHCPAGGVAGGAGALDGSFCFPGCLLVVNSAGATALANPATLFQVLALLPPTFNASGGYAWGARQPALVAPSPSPSPSPSPTPSASLAPPPPNTAQWMRLGNLSGWPGVLEGGTESGVWPPTQYTEESDKLFVCRCVVVPSGWSLLRHAPLASPPTPPFSAAATCPPLATLCPASSTRAGTGATWR